MWKVWWNNMVTHTPSYGVAVVVARDAVLLHNQDLPEKTNCL